MKISHRPINGRQECIIQLYWYASCGSYLVETVGYGTSPEEAEKAARLLLGQARAKLIEVTTTKETA